MAIKMETQEVEASAAKYKTSSQQINDILSTLKSEQDRLRGAWEGGAFESFDSRFVELEPKIQAFIEVVDGIGGQLTSAAQAMAETDEAIANMAR